MRKMTELRWFMILETKAMSQKDISMRSGLSMAQLSNWLNGKSSPTAVNAIKVCKAISKISGKKYERLLVRMMYCIELDAGLDV
jgi:transcriptional regulator with XRE-family HTH domain